jgi:hypothetical protein
VKMPRYVVDKIRFEGKSNGEGENKEIVEKYKLNVWLIKEKRGEDIMIELHYDWRRDEPRLVRLYLADEFGLDIINGLEFNRMLTLFREKEIKLKMTVRNDFYVY